MEILINNFNFQVESNIENERKNVTVIPFPDSIERFENASRVLGFESLNLLWSKHYFGINHRNHMFRVLYDTFEDHFSIEEKTIDHYLTLQVLYCDMIIRLGTILEDFAGICFACKEHTINEKDIAEVFLAYSDPMGFYNSITSRRGRRQIKQIFRLPESKGNLNRIFNNLTNNEIEVLWKGIEASTQLIVNTMESISTSIVRREDDSMTYYDMYNKLKHGFAPVYPFAMPVPFPINAPVEIPERELILKYMMENITVMHDKLPGQRSADEQQKYDTLRLATPAFTYEEVHMETVGNILRVVNDIDYLYKYLVKRYISYAEGSKKISLLMINGLLSEDEQEIILNIIEDDQRYL
ncbi:hypothetical protein [Neobacillus soli]|uniref:hypothetical protein n=1 Tax=Neobacillus soli TaxID=220688 RepID=UPI00082414A6|nr:hypothetical protein [Neobacillus soli]